MKNHPAFKIWLGNCLEVLIPLALYFILQNLLQILALSLLGDAFYFEHSISVQGLGNLLLLPILCLAFCRKNLFFSRNHLRPGGILLVFGSSACLSRGLNYLLELSALPFWFPSCENVSAAIQREPFGIQLLSAVIIAPLLEELLMRGIVYGRLKELTRNTKTAVLGSALFFGLFHGNLLQGIYAFFLGILFAWLLEQYHTLWAPVLAHAAANGASLLQGVLNEKGYFMREWALEALLSAALLLAGYIFTRMIERGCRNKD